MPLYTFKCPKCKDVKEVLQGMNDKPPICSECSTILPRRYIDMERVFKVNAKPHSKDGSWDFKKKKKEKPK